MKEENDVNNKYWSKRASQSFVVQLRSIISQLTVRVEVGENDVYALMYDYE